MLEQLSYLPYRIVLIDDGSADDTARQAGRFDVCVLRHAWNLGQGAALQTGIAYALRWPETRFIVTFDADGQHCAQDIVRVLAPLEAGTHDVTLGSRFAKGGTAVGIPVTRQALLWLATALTRITTGLRISDTHNGIRGLTASAAGRISITQNRMAHASEILSRIAGHQLRYCEVPVTIRYTEYSMSKGQRLLDAVTIMWDIMTARIR